jgi:hypothetical protein
MSDTSSTSRPIEGTADLILHTRGCHGVGAWHGLAWSPRDKRGLGLGCFLRCPWVDIVHVNPVQLEHYTHSDIIG